jgi:tetratricopeptide (TPR) repeat protein
MADEFREAGAHFERGVLLENGNDLNGARSAYEQAVAVDPRHVEAVASLAWLDAQAGNTASAAAFGERALDLDAENVLARMALASAGLQAGELEEASSRLARLYADPALTGVNRSIVLGMVGDLNDALGESARAFKAYEAANAKLAALNPTNNAGGDDDALGHVRRLIAWFESAEPANWRDRPVSGAKAADPSTHVFLVGFPRSGTTLLENVLATHPDVVALEEKETLGQAALNYLMSDRGLEQLERIDAGEAENQRDSYWSAVRSFGVEPKGRLFIDKMPLATILLPIISKLFPTARIFFAVRDPRDVVLSCFRRRFGMNAAMAQFLSVEGAATYYDAVMRLAELYRELLPIQQHVVRYESLVEDFEGTARAACDFIRLDWRPGMADFATTVRTRGVSTPSAAQLARGLNQEGRGAWRRYREQLNPVLPTLEPWVERFGYDPS